MASNGNNLPGLAGSEVLAAGYVNFSAQAGQSISVPGLTSSHIIIASLASNVANCFATGQYLADGIMTLYTWRVDTGSGLNMTGRINYVVLKPASP